MFRVHELSWKLEQKAAQQCYSWFWLRKSSKLKVLKEVAGGLKRIIGISKFGLNLFVCPWLMNDWFQFRYNSFLPVNQVIANSYILPND